MDRIYVTIVYNIILYFIIYYFERRTYMHYACLIFPRSVMNQFVTSRIMFLENRPRESYRSRAIGKKRKIKQVSWVNLRPWSWCKSITTIIIIMFHYTPSGPIVSHLIRTLIYCRWPKTDRSLQCFVAIGLVYTSSLFIYYYKPPDWCVLHQSGWKWSTVKK